MQRQHLLWHNERKSLGQKISKGFDNAIKISDAFNFTVRQSSYYREATELFGLIESVKSKYQLTELGKEYLSKSVEERSIFLMSCMLKIPIMYLILEKLNKNLVISQYKITELIQKKSGLTGTTPKRRTNTIMSWLKWIQNNLGILSVNHDVVSKVQ